MHRAVVDYIEVAVQLRLSLYRRYITDEQLRLIVHIPLAEWEALRDAVRALQAAGVPPSNPSAWTQALRWKQLFDRLTQGDAGLQQGLRRGNAEEPMLSAGAALPPDVRDYLMKAGEAAQSAAAAAAAAADGAHAATSAKQQQSLPAP